METRVMWEGSRTPYSRARGSLNPTDRPESARPEAPATRRNFENISYIFNLLPSCGASARSPHAIRAGPLGAAQTNRSGPLGWTIRISLNYEVMPCELSILLPLSFDRRFRPALLHARRLRGRSGLSALQYRAHRRERLSHLGGGGRLRRERAFDRSEGKHADDQRRETDEGREEQRRGALPGH